MTTFTDDLENDLEVLAERFGLSPRAVAQAALAQVPEHERLSLLHEELAKLPRFPEPVSEDPEPVAPRVQKPTEAELIDGETGQVLVVVEGMILPRAFDYVDADGLTIRYTRPVGSDCHYQFGADGRSIMRATYSKEVIG